MARNYETIAEMGETGFLITTPLDDEDGLVENLDGWTITMTVKRSNGTVIIQDEACTIVDSEERTISCSIDITTAAYPNMVKGDHRIKFTGVDSNGKTHKFPKSRRHEYGILKVIQT